jgi:dipeptidyl aminopeptidase/acylaminoacyl peptidase
LDTQFWTSRGFAVVDVNYGGSTGYGREYRERLYGNWGIVDVNDCVNAALYLSTKGSADPERLLIVGRSASGFTALCALTFRDTFRCGASYYGISDLEALTTDTHKFELHILDRLVGPYPERADIYVARSPIRHVDQIERPIAFFQGLEDKVVPASQTMAMVEALNRKKIPVACLLFKEERHGFRRAETIKRVLEGELSFYAQILGFQPADNIQPVSLEMP